MRRMLPWVTLALVVGLVPARAFADTSVIVLGIQSIEGDDDFARDLTGAIRHAASQVRGWTVSDRDVSLSQMTVMSSCAEPDAACMSEIAHALSTQRILYGVVRRTSTGANFRFSVTVSVFNSDTGAIENSVTDTIPRNEAEIDFLRQRVRRYITELAGTPQVGSVAVRSSVPEAQVAIDGTPAGATAGGAFTATNVAAGPHVVEVSAAGYQTYTTRINVEVGSQAEVSAELMEESGGDGHDRGPGGHGGFPWRPVLGWSAIGLGAVFGGLAIFEALSINALNHSGGGQDGSTWRQYRGAVQPGDDACDKAAMGYDPLMNAPQVAAAVRVCNSASTMQTLQWVFTGIGAAAGIGGIVLLLTGGGGSSTERASAETRLREPRLVLTPAVGPNGGALSATLRF